MKLISTIALLLGVMIAPVQAATTLKIATVAPDGTSWMRLMRQAADDIESATEGRVKVRYFPGGVQGTDKAVLRKMQIRQLQGGAVASGALAHITNMTQLYSLPFTFRNLDEIRAVRAEYDQRIAAALEEQGYILLGLSEGGFAYLMSNSPLRTSDDVRSKKVWMPEGDMISETIFTNGKVQPIALPISDVYTSLQTGLIDTLAVNASSAIALQWHTKLNYATDYPLVFLFGMLVVDARAFKGISAADQQVVRTAMAAAFKAMDGQNETDEQGAREALQQNGLEFVALSEADKEAWRQLAADSIASLRERKVYPVETYNQLLQTLTTLRNSTSN
ncbi:C4-dicarboxylate ABC transporter [Venatoribacter cucullus]|uniref:C4-dicarboxylate ABC transporter n=1 Tax=Venatoribacter cucullus TaxID=2661630 RepID=A0A9X7V046_9GAMM|nr:TRAP transporter substrate-binding protein DctP [Venatoribacter cucullus]QQD23179.1 C4-dicarboxylate ABC transporter [Venatoribacter cucullus]